MSRCVVIYYNESIQAVPDLSGYSGPVRSSPVYLVSTYNTSGIVACRLPVTWYYQVPWANPAPVTRVMYS